LLLAAGIGITPLYAMALQLKATGTPFTLHYYVKTGKARRLRELSRSVSASFIPPARAQRWRHLPVAESGSRLGLRSGRFYGKSA
jgi:vanillate O-demethylase ferredoxin subunit